MTITVETLPVSIPSADQAPAVARNQPVYAFFEGKFVSLAEAKVSVLAHGFAYGTGVFEGIRGYWSPGDQQLYFFRLREHFERLLHSSKMLLMTVPHTMEGLIDITTELARRSDIRDDCYVRPCVYKSSEVIGVRLHDLKNDLSVIIQTFGNYIDIDRPLKVGVSSWRRVSDNAVPARAKITGSYVNSAFAKTEAVLNGFDEAIVLTNEGHVAEGSAENFFMMRGGRLITPPITDDLLEGITRTSVIELARQELGLEVVERSIDRTELYTADEIFLTGTGAQIAPVGEVDHRIVGDGEVGPISSRLQTLYFDVVRGKVARYRSWLTPTY